MHTHAAQDRGRRFLPGLFTTALNEGELITAIALPDPEARGVHEVQAAGLALPLVGVFVAQFDSGVRVAVTGGGNGVFRHQGLEDALTQELHAGSRGRREDRCQRCLSSDLHATAAYRANLISVLTQRAVTKALG